MIDFGKWALDNRLLIRFLVIIMLVGGALSFYDMSKLEDPEIKVKEAMVVTTYPGASAHEVELEVTDPLEKNIRSMYNIDNIQSNSMNDVSIITLELKATTPNDEVEQYFDMLRRKVSDVQTSLPSGAGESVVLDDFGDVYGMFYAMTSDGFSDKELGDYADFVKREIQNIEGISKVNIYGKQNECIYIELVQNKMANLGVHPAEVFTTLHGQNSTVYSGYYDAGDTRLRVTVNDRYKNAEDIGDLLIQGHENDLLRLKDIATVYTGYEDPVRNSLTYDDRKALGISIAAQSGTDITKIGREVEKRLDELTRTRIPEGIEFHKVFFQPQRVKDALGTFVINLLESVLIVIVILMLTMGIRSGLIIGISLSVIVFGSIMILGFLDGTLQRVSLASLIVAMGMLVDNAIVIVDGILVDLQRGRPQEEALTSIGRKTCMPLFGATLIAILAFLPIFLSPDTAGVYVRDLFIVLAVSLLLSWILAITHVPIMARSWLKVKKQEDGNENSIHGGRAYRMLYSSLHWSIRHKYFTLTLAVLLVLSSIFCYRFIPQEFFPDMNYDQFYIEYKMPEGTSSQRVEKDLKEISGWLRQKEEITHVTISVGGTPSRYNLVRSIATPSMSYGELIVDFTSPEALVKNMESIQDSLTGMYPDAYIRVKRYNLMFKKYPIELQFSGPDPAVLKKLTAEAEEIMKKNPKTRLVCNDWEPEQPSLVIDYNQPTARSVGLSRNDVGMSLLTVNGGIPTGTFYEGNHRKTIFVKSVGSGNRHIDRLDNVPIFSNMLPIHNLSKDMVIGIMNGSISEEELLTEAFKTIPLSQATKGVKIEWEDPLVVRYDGQRAMRAQCEPAPGESAESARLAIEPQIEQMEIPEEYSYMWLGEKKASSQSTQYLFKNFPLAIILMIAILIMLFKDYRKPTIIFCCVPLIFVGVVYGILLSGKTFGFVAIVGVLGLVGMMIKNGVVLMDEITLQLSEGKNPLDALLDSSMNRFRPVMMASLTTILGMVPLITDDMFGSLAVTIMSGLFVGTLITLLFIPVLYAIFFKIK